MGGKCFPTTGTFKGLGQAYLEIHVPLTRVQDINKNTSSEIASQYHGILVHVYDHTNNEHALNYEELTELGYNNYVTILIDKHSVDRYRYFPVTTKKNR